VNLRFFFRLESGEIAFLEAVISESPLAAGQRVPTPAGKSLDFFAG
jgi:hypothetical protein